MLRSLLSRRVLLRLSIIGILFSLLMNCYTVRVVDPYLPLKSVGERCTLNRPAHVTVIYTETRNFRKRIEDESAREIARRKRGIENLGVYIGEEVRRELNTDIQADATLRVEVVVRHIHTAKDQLRTRFRGARTCLSCLTFLIYPTSGETEEKIKIRFITGNRKIREHEYLFHRLSYFGWLLIPFNVFVSPFTDSYTIDPDIKRIDFRAVMKNLTARIRKDVAKLKCEIARSEHHPVAFKRTEPGERVSRRPSGE